IFGVFVTGLPLEANVFVRWFPVTREDGIETAATHHLIITASRDDGRVIGDRKLVKRSTNVCVCVHRLPIADCQLENASGLNYKSAIGNRQLAIHYDCRLTITSVISSAALVPCANFVND